MILIKKNNTPKINREKLKEKCELKIGKKIHRRRGKKCGLRYHSNQPTAKLEQKGGGVKRRKLILKKD